MDHLLVSTDRKVKELRSLRSEALQTRQRLCGWNRSAQALLQYGIYRIVGFRGESEEGLNSAQVESICGHFANAMAENKTLETRYLYLVDENDRLKVLNSELRHEFLALINATSGANLDSIKETATLLSNPQVPLTYNQLLTGVDEIAGREGDRVSLEEQEKVGLEFFSCLVEMGGKMTGMVRRGQIGLERLTEKMTALLEAIEGVGLGTNQGDTDAKSANSALLSISSIVGKLFPATWAERLMLHIRNYPMLQLLLTPADILLFSKKWKHDEPSFVELLCQLVPASHASLHYKASTLISNIISLLYVVSAEEETGSDRACEKAYENSLEEGGRIRTEPADMSVYEETGETVSAVLSSRSKIVSPRKGKESDMSQTARKSTISLSPRKTAVKLKLFDTFQDVDEEEEELNLLFMARQALKMKNRISTDAAFKPLPRLSTYIQPHGTARSSQFEDVRKLRSSIAKLRLQGTLQTELESQGKKRFRRSVVPFIRRDTLKLAPTSLPDWKKNMYFPLLQYSMKQQVKGLIHSSDTALTS